MSSHQAWMEGSIETADLAVDAWRTSDDVVEDSFPPSVPSSDRRTGCGMYVNGNAFTRAAAALENHLGEDVTHLMRQMGHSDHAYAVAFALHYNT